MKLLFHFILIRYYDPFSSYLVSLCDLHPLVTMNLIKRVLPWRRTVICQLYILQIGTKFAPIAENIMPDACCFFCFFSCVLLYKFCISWLFFFLQMVEKGTALLRKIEINVPEAEKRTGKNTVNMQETYTAYLIETRWVTQYQICVSA